MHLGKSRPGGICFQPHLAGSLREWPAGAAEEQGRRSTGRVTVASGCSHFWIHVMLQLSLTKLGQQLLHMCIFEAPFKQPKCL